VSASSEHAALLAFIPYERHGLTPSYEVGRCERKQISNGYYCSAM